MAGERIVKVLNAKRDEVFQAWSEPGLVREWMNPGGRQLSNINMDFSPGGSFQIDLADPSGTLTHVGNFLDIKPPKSLSFTWAPLGGNSTPIQVDVTFDQVGDATRMTITHDHMDAAGDGKPVSFQDIANALTRFVGK